LRTSITKENENVYYYYGNGFNRDDVISTAQMPKVKHEREQRISFVSLSKGTGVGTLKIENKTKTIILKL